MTILITRPQPSAGELAATLTAKGLSVIKAPLFTIHFYKAESPHFATDHCQAVVFTSGNGVRAYAEAGYSPLELAVTVGDSTAGLALAAGFKRALSAEGDLRDLVALIKKRLKPEDGALFHPRGAAGAGSLPRLLAGFTVRCQTLYRAEAISALPEEVTKNLAKISHALFYSPRTARLFCRLARKLSLGHITALGLSPAVAKELAKSRWRRIKTAARPTEPSLLSLLEIG